MSMEILGGRRSLTLDEQESLFRQGLKDELARATAHITAPIGCEEPHPLLHKMMAMAYRIVMRLAELRFFRVIGGPPSLAGIVVDATAHLHIGVGKRIAAGLSATETQAAFGSSTDPSHDR